MRLRLATCLIAAITLVAQAQRPADFQISGVVVNAASGQVLPRTRVQIASTDDRQQTQGVVTGADGHFQFDHLPSGKYQLTAQRAGYPTQFFDQHDNYSSAIAVGPDKKSADIVFRLQPEAVISGTILDEANEPVRDAEVMLFHRAVEEGQLTTHLARQTRPDDQGHFHFEQLLAGEFLIAVRARPWYAQNSPLIVNGKDQPVNPVLNVAYPITFYPGVSEAESASPIRVGSGDRATADFLLRPVPSLRLTIRGSDIPNRQLSAHLTQKLFDDFDSFVQSPGFSSNEGFFLNGVAPGRYMLHINSSSGNDRVQEINLSGDTTIDSDDAQQTSAVNVSGIVEASGYTLPSRMVVQLEGRSPRQVYGAQVLRDGKFEFKQVAPGTYNLRIGAPGFYPGRIVASGAAVNGRSLRIGSGDVSLAIQVSQGVGKITGTVLNGDSPQAEAMVLLVPVNPGQNPTLFRRDQTDSDGTFTLAEVVPGQYTAVAIMDGWNIPYTNPSSLKPYLAQGEPVNVNAGAKLDIKIKMQSLAR
jgi:hypothetical protein